MSVYHRYLSLRPHFASHVNLSKPKAVQMVVVHGLVKHFPVHYSIEALKPNRVEPMTMRIIRRQVKSSEDGRHRISNRVWSLADCACFIETACLEAAWVPVKMRARCCHWTLT